MLIMKTDLRVVSTSSSPPGTRPNSISSRTAQQTHRCALTRATEAGEALERARDFGTARAVHRRARPRSPQSAGLDRRGRENADERGPEGSSERNSRIDAERGADFGADR